MNWILVSSCSLGSLDGTLVTLETVAGVLMIVGSVSLLYCMESPPLRCGLVASVRNRVGEIRESRILTM